MAEREQQILNQIPEHMKQDPRSLEALFTNSDVVEAIKTSIKAAQPKIPVRPHTEIK